MLKKRIIPSLLIKDNKLVKGKKFNNYVNVGNPVSAIKVYSHQYADELIFIRIDNSDPISDLINALKLASENCFAPLTAGGGIKEQNEINLLCKNGADKVLLNSILHYDKKFLKDASKNFGRSTLVAGIDIIEENSKFFITYNCNKNINRETNLIDWLKFLEDNGAGELYINFVNNDGMMNGYKISLAQLICNNTSLPVIFNGGAGNFNHLYELFTETKVSAAGCSSIFHFGDNNPIRANTYLRSKKINLKKN